MLVAFPLSTLRLGFFIRAGFLSSSVKSRVSFSSFLRPAGLIFDGMPVPSDLFRPDGFALLLLILFFLLIKKLLFYFSESAKIFVTVIVPEVQLSVLDLNRHNKPFLSGLFYAYFFIKFYN